MSNVPFDLKELPTELVSGPSGKCQSVAQVSRDVRWRQYIGGNF